MQSTPFVERAASWARRLEDREAKRSGSPIVLARDAVARRTLIAAGTLENLRKGRLKAIAAHVYESLRAAMVRELASEVRSLEQEIDALVASGADARASEIRAILASLQEARKALGAR
jgi:hypothetical protein